jgi:hypothetical protein
VADSVTQNRPQQQQQQQHPPTHQTTYPTQGRENTNFKSKKMQQNPKMQKVCK